ncbi:MAG: SpoIIIAH-like family protein [Bacillota bacterium]
MTIITNRYTLGLVLMAFFSAIVYIGYMELKPVQQMPAINTIGSTSSSEYEMIMENEKYGKTEFTEGTEYFIEYKLERDRIRDTQLDLLRQIVENPNSVAETRREAQQEILQITKYLEQELQLEYLILAKGFEEAVVFIQPQSVTVVINQDIVKDADAMKIVDLVTTVTTQSMDNIFIIPKGFQPQK